MTIRDREELERFRKALSAVAKANVAFPLTILRDSKEVALFQSSGFYVDIYTYTKDGKTKTRMAQANKESRKAWEKREEAFDAH